MSSSSTLLSRFREYVGRQRLISKLDRIIVGVSGGLDSMVLLDLLAKDQARLELDIVVAHFNHRLRGSESEGDEQFVAGRAGHYGFEFIAERADTAEYARVNKLGIQEAARELRYRFFDTLLHSHGFTRTATAHTANDNAETILLNLCRGAGVSGLSGIPPFNEQQSTIRPLLFAQRDELEQYTKLEWLPFRTDSSNAKDTYTRNFIRHQVLSPIQERVNPNIIKTLGQTAEVFGELETFLVSTARESSDDVVHETDRGQMEISIPALQRLPKIIQQYTIMLATERLIGKRPDYRHVNAVLSLSDGQTGSFIPLGNNHHVFRDREKLVLRKGESTPEFRISVQQNRDYELPAFRFSSTLVTTGQAQLHKGRDVEYVDAERIQNSALILRSWHDGDAFVPLGMTAKKKVSDFLIDEKVPVFEKRSIPILETESGDIVWLCGRRIDDRFKINNETNKILKLEFTRRADEKNRQG